MRNLISVADQSDPANVTAQNPHGYWPAYRDRPEQAFADALAATHAFGCAGTLLWDWGGAGGVFYAGTPWLRDRPEAFYDAHVRGPWTDAGLWLGGTICPQRCYCGRREFPADVYGALAEKVDWARSRLGWTRFYVDANWLSASDNSKGNLIEPGVFARLAVEFPDCEYYPEGARKDYEGLANVRPLRHFPNPAQNATPPLIRMPPTFNPNALQRADLRRSFAQGAWGLVSATAPKNPANALVASAAGAAAERSN